MPTTPALRALTGLDADLRDALLRQVRDLWTHGSTALEGNTLTLGETKFVIEEGLTVSGKPLKDHQEVIGHARAIELLYGWRDDDVDEEKILDLHRAVATAVHDVHHPVGEWKREPNGTYAVAADGRQVFIEYARPEDVPALTRLWVEDLAGASRQNLGEDAAIAAYARLHLGFVHIHPFWDGNGRVARLLANLPLLRSGHLPLIVEVERRKRYIDALAEYEIACGPLTPATGVLPRPDLETPFREFCREAYGATRRLLEAARAQQQRRCAAGDR